MTIGTRRRPHVVVLHIVKPAGAHPAQSAAVQRLRRLLYLISRLRVGALLLGARISRQREHDGCDGRRAAKKRDEFAPPHGSNPQPANGETIALWEALVGMGQCPLWVKRRPQTVTGAISASPPKADMPEPATGCPLSADSGHHAGLSATATYASWGDVSWPSRSISGSRNDSATDATVPVSASLSAVLRSSKRRAMGVAVN